MKTATKKAAGKTATKKAASKPKRGSLEAIFKAADAARKAGVVITELR